VRLGLLDDSVLVDALEKANEDFDLVVYPRAHCGYEDMAA
jgi:hypothetical protein